MLKSYRLPTDGRTVSPGDKVYRYDHGPGRLEMLVIEAIFTTGDSEPDEDSPRCFSCGGHIRSFDGFWSTPAESLGAALKEQTAKLVHARTALDLRADSMKAIANAMTDYIGGEGR